MFKIDDKVYLEDGTKGIVLAVESPPDSSLADIPVQVKLYGKEGTYCFTVDGRNRLGGEVILMKEKS